MVQGKNKQAWGDTPAGRLITLFSLSVNGFKKITKDVVPIEGNDSIFYSIAVPVLLVFPIAAASVSLIVDAGYTWSSDLHILLTPGIGFLVVFRCTSAFNRFWEARGHLSKAIKGCRTLAIIVITQYHRHAGKPGDDIPKAVDDVRRYLLVYFHTMINQLHETEVRQPNIEDFVTKQEMDLLLRRRTGQAITALKWIGARLAYLESLGYLSPLQLHETNESLTLLIESFNGLTKIKSTPIPFPIRQLCSLLTVIYVYSAPLALATAFRGFTEYWNIMGRTVGGSVSCRTPPTLSPQSPHHRPPSSHQVLLALAFFGINQTAVDLEDPLGSDANDLPLDRMGQALIEELNGLFSEPIPILKAPNEEKAA